MDALIPLAPGARVRFWYKNYKGEEGERTVRVKGVEWGGTDWHPGQQALLRAVDEEKGAERLFAIADIRDLSSLD